MLVRFNNIKYTVKLTISVFIISLFVLPSLFQVYALTNTISHTSQIDFNKGSISSTLDTSISPGDIKLKQDKNVLTESSYDDFKLGQSLQNGTILNPSSGDSSIKLDKEVTSINNLHEPLLHYTFDEGSGKVIANTGSTPGSNGFLGRNDPCITDCANWVDGKYGKSLQLDGLSKMAQIPSSSSNNFSKDQDFSVSVWIKIDPIQPDGYCDQDIIEKWGLTGNNGQGYPFVIRYFRCYGIIVAGRYDGSPGLNNPSLGSIRGLDDNNYHHIVFAKKGEDLFLYVDGDINKGGTKKDTTTGNTTNNFPVFLGARENRNFFKGEIDDLKIYDYGMSQSEILTEYKASSYYLSRTRKISDTPTSSIQWENTNTLNTLSTLQYRTGAENLVWEDNFDSTLNSYAGDLYGWGDYFQNVSTQNGVITMSNPSSSWGGYVWFDTGKGAGYYPVGSTITAKVRMNNSHPTRAYEDYMFTDEWDDGEVIYNTVNDWVYLKLTPSLPFSTIGFEPYLMDYNGWYPEDSFQIDWIKVEMPFSNWSSWSSPCTNSSYCPINQSDLTGKTWIQYKMNLSTSNTTETPIIDSVSYLSGYQPSGEYISSVLDGSKKVKWKSMTVGSNIPTNTSLSVLTRTGSTLIPDSSWSDWMTFTNKQTGRYLQYKVTLATTDENLTPTLSDISFTYSPITVIRSTSSSSSEETSLTESSISSTSMSSSSSTSSVEVIETTKEITIKDENGNVLKNTVVIINGKTYITDSKGKVKAEVAGVYVIEYDKGGVKYASTIKSSESIATLKARSTPNILIYIFLCIAGILVLGILVLFIRRRKKNE